MRTPVKPIPEGYHSVPPYLIIRNAAKALDFYARAFGAVELFRMEAPEGRIGRAEIRLGDSTIMLADEHPEIGAKSPDSWGGSPVNLMLYVENVDQSSPRRWRPAPWSNDPWRTSSTGTAPAD